MIRFDALVVLACLSLAACDPADSGWVRAWKLEHAVHRARLAECRMHCDERGGRPSLEEVGDAAWCGCRDGSGTFVE